MSDLREQIAKLEHKQWKEKYDKLFEDAMEWRKVLIISKPKTLGVKVVIAKMSLLVEELSAKEGG